MLQVNLPYLYLTNKADVMMSTAGLRGGRMLFAAFAIVFGGIISQTSAQNSWQIAVPGNGYLTQEGDGSSGQVSRNGIRQWQSSESRFSLFFRVDRACELTLALNLRVPAGESDLQVSAAGKVFALRVAGAELHPEQVGAISVSQPGYVRVDLQGISKTGAVFAEVADLLVSSSTSGLNLNYVKDNESNRFYWGRRGPSVHLSYITPPDKTIEWFYSEVTVPEGEDAIGSYFMANGFGEGYFGIQVNGPAERRILFSVWSPFHTDNPAEIPESDRIALLKKGDGVYTGEFGNEGSGGQSYLVFPWKAGHTYGFLNSAKPDGKGNTIYSAYFYAPEKGRWQLIASFRRPKTNTYLVRPHSFLENFSDKNGYLGRKAWYANQWARDTDGNWHELTGARFTGDDIARRSYRLDYAGGASGNRFFLQNGGFFNETIPLNTVFTREGNAGKAPEIPFAELE